MNTVHFETTLCNFLDRYLVDRDCIDMHKPECPDVADKMVGILNSFIHDAVKEYNSYPLATLSWMMYTGMALAKYWDLEWDVYSKVDDLYVYLRDKRGYDAMDDYIMDEVLCLKGEDKIKLQNLVMNCASGANDMLIHSGVESGTREAFELFVSCLRQMYMYGIYIELKSLGYHMTAIN